MLRWIVRGLIFSNVRRSSPSHTHNLLHSRSLANTCRNLNIMEQQPFEKMAEEGIPKCESAADTSDLKPAEKELPPLSQKEFRVYNQMAEHMNMFVGLSGSIAAGEAGR